MRRSDLTDEAMAQLASRTDVGHAMIDRVDEHVRAFFEAHPGELTKLDFGYGQQSLRMVSEEEWPVVRQRLRDMVVSVGRGET